MTHFIKPKRGIIKQEFRCEINPINLAVTYLVGLQSYLTTEVYAREITGRKPLTANSNKDVRVNSIIK